jgi:hypothetical protein
VRKKSCGEKKGGVEEWRSGGRREKRVRETESIKGG